MKLKREAQAVALVLVEVGGCGGRKLKQEAQADAEWWAARSEGHARRRALAIRASNQLMNVTFSQ